MNLLAGDVLEGVSGPSVSNGPPMSMSPGETDKPSSFVAPVEPLIISSSAPPAGCPSYPPTEVRRWLTCPVFRDYSARWEPRVEAWTPHKLIGTAIHAGVASHLRSLMAGSASPATDPIASAIANGVAALRDGYVQQETWGLDGLETMVTKGVTRLTQAITEKLLPGATIVAVEYADPVQDVRLGTHRLHRVVDCVLERNRALEIWDWKTKMRLDDQYLPETQQEALHQWQLLDYAWHAQEWFGKMVSRIGWGLAILAPKLKVEFIPVPVTPERLEQWAEDAKPIWEMMAAQDGDGPMLLPRWHNWTACSDKHLHYGKRCVFFEACHIYLDNEALFPGLYQPVKDKHGLLHAD